MGFKLASGERQKGLFAAVPVLGAALLPKVVCAACWPAYTAALGAAGIEFFNYTPYIVPLTSFAGPRFPGPFGLETPKASAHHLRPRSGHGHHSRQVHARIQPDALCRFRDAYDYIALSLAVESSRVLYLIQAQSPFWRYLWQSHEASEDARSVSLSRNTTLGENIRRYPRSAGTAGGHSNGVRHRWSTWTGSPPFARKYWEQDTSCG
jgi:hypothetical protein